jgi:predicted amidohydrolase
LQGDVDANLSAIELILKEAHTKQLDLVLFAELFVTGYDVPPEELKLLSFELGGEALGRIAAMAKDAQVGVAVGYSEVDPTTTTYYNSCVLFDATGNMM